MVAHNNVIVLPFLNESQDIFSDLVGIARIRHSNVNDYFRLVFEAGIRHDFICSRDDLTCSLSLIIRYMYDVKCPLVSSDEFGSKL